MLRFLLVHEKRLPLKIFVMTADFTLQIPYSLRLASCPLKNEKIQIHISGVKGGQLSVQPETLEFTADNWQQEQTVVLYVAQDDFAPSEVKAHTNLSCRHVKYSLTSASCGPRKSMA